VEIPDEELDGAVAAAVLAELRSICLGLPDAYEEPAWVGRRWCVRKKTFAHVFHADLQSTPAVARIAEALGPSTMLVFRSAGEELDVLRHQGPPFFYAGWGRDVVSLRVDDDTDWEEVAELVTESYCRMAPKKLQALLDRPQA
jgi:hypothetical protein